MKISEIFSSIQGEGLYSGTPSVFIRTATCNHNCKFCDTRYSLSSGQEMTVSQIISEIQKYSHIQHLIITGGEPLLQQEELLELLLQIKFQFKFITLETNGALYPNSYLKPLIDFYSVSPKLKGMFDYSWEQVVTQYILELYKKLQLKFVIVTKEDYEEVKNRLNTLEPSLKFSVPIILQPNGMTNTLNEYTKNFGELALQVVNDPYWKTYEVVRVMMQSHRVAWKQKSGI